ncbi:BolA/IbaG family iron-sulfur metabolism protein [Rickettsiales bacterium]|jgi:stress-induced morphogen|nr:BolA/IbaG family iron-sulfur metabolism protein [Rickettsiales bacterium]|tara:strand:+ start:5861 stop:6091 length:231 start_codon:yes stop_codon:yes gene_type:complete
MPVPQNKIEQALLSALPRAKIEIKDLVGDQNHYQITITDKIFINKTKIAQHRIVNEILKDLLKMDLHAMQLKTLTP